MNFKPILFSTPMVQAILEGRKTQTRRIIKSRHKSGLFQVSKSILGTVTSIDSLDWDEQPLDETNDIKPLATKGDILWVRETWQQHCQVGCNKNGVFYESTEDYVYRADGSELPKNSKAFGKWKPSIFMPKAACRIFLEVTNVRVERLQDLSEDDAIAEGIEEIHPAPFVVRYKNYLNKNLCVNPKSSFCSLWQSINGKESWNDNPWVWVYDFKRVEKPENFLL